MLQDRMLASEEYRQKGMIPYLSAKITGNARKRAEFVVTVLRNQQGFGDNYIKL